MTLTTMGCPLADLLTDQIYDAMSDVPEVTKTDVKLVWYPTWTVEKMSRYAPDCFGDSLRTDSKCWPAVCRLCFL